MWFFYGDNLACCATVARRLWVQFPPTCYPCVCTDLLLEAPKTCTPGSLQTDNLKPSVGVSMSADGCLSQCGPAMNRRLVLSVTPPPQDSWDGRQHPCDPESGISGDGNRMDVV